MQCFCNLPSLRLAWTIALCALALPLALAGCAHRGEVDVLEAEMRQQEEVQQQLAQQNARLREDLKVADSDRSALRSQLNKNHQVSFSQEQADVLYRAEAIKFNKLLTSGQDRDGEPGDEGLSVVLIPVDAHGDLVKLAGEVDLDLFDMTLESDQQRLGRWKFPIDEVRTHWHSGLIATGYLFQLDWQKPPAARELTLHARLSIPDGRKFDVTSQVQVEPPASARPVARTGKPPRRKGPSTPLSGQPALSGVTPAAGTVKTRRPNYADSANPDSAAANSTGASPDTSKPKINPAPVSESSEQPVRTSDKWMNEMIPVVR